MNKETIVKLINLYTVQMHPLRTPSNIMKKDVPIRPKFTKEDCRHSSWDRQSPQCFRATTAASFSDVKIWSRGGVRRQWIPKRWQTVWWRNVTNRLAATEKQWRGSWGCSSRTWKPEFHAENRWAIVLPPQSLKIPKRTFRKKRAWVSSWVI